MLGAHARKRLQRPGLDQLSERPSQVAQTCGRPQIGFGLIGIAALEGGAAADFLEKVSNLAGGSLRHAERERFGGAKGALPLATTAIR